MNVGVIESEHRLALGIEPRDAIRELVLARPVRIDIEGPLPWTPQLTQNTNRTYRQAVLPGASRPVVSRHNSCRHTLIYPTEPVVLSDTIDIRIYDHRRWYVPRRFRVPLFSAETILEQEQSGGSIPVSSRIRLPVLFPGAAYDCGYLATGLRGRVRRDGQAMRWARIEARMPSDNSVVVGRAHGDDRGEFLLILSPESGETELANPIEIDVVIFGPETVPEPATEQLPQQDVWWDLPLEEFPPIGGLDPVATGHQLPTGYVQGATATVDFQAGRMISAANGVSDFNFNPSP